jgi:hypothetical protein
VRIELEESVLHVHVGSPDFLGEFSVLRVVEVFVLESDKRCRQWDRLSERVRVGENEQRLGLGNRSRKRLGANEYQRGY